MAIAQAAATSTAGIHQTTRGMRRMLLIAAGLVFITGVQLFVLSTQTDQFFAWTIKPPLTAAFLGAAYWASCVLELLASRERVWARARCAVPAVLIFTALTLVATLLHVDRFHFGAPEASARAAAGAWLAGYAAVPVALILLLAQQARASGGDPPRAAPMPAWFRRMLVAQAALLLLCGAALFLAPGAAAPLWPWALTPLTARAVGAWLLGLGIAVGQGAWEGDFVRTRPVAISGVVLALLQAAAIARFPVDVRWEGVAIWLVLAFLASLLAVGLYGWRRARPA